MALSGDKRFVLLASSNAHKVAEYESLLSLYGINVQQCEPRVFKDYGELAKVFSNPKCIAVLKDEATLVTDDRTPAALDKAGLAHSIVSLQAKLRNGNFSSYRADLAGFVDPSRRVTGSSAAAFSVFGWDDVFVPLSTGESLHARRAAGSKVSNRDAVVSDFLHEHVHYARLKDLSHAAALTHPREAVDFSIDPAEFVARHPLLSKGLVVPGFGGVLRAVINGGLFFRAADSRRTGNYWWPGLNAGLPFVAKGDDVHEATFMAHDFGHYLIPDRIPSGSAFSRSPAGRRLYIAQRMASEAQTMVLADMLFTEGLRLVHGLEYDWNARKIWPLLREASRHTGLALLLPPSADSGSRGWQLNLPFLRSLLSANMSYVLLGDEDEWRALLGDTPEAEAAFSVYRRKFAPFFVADYEWTDRNAADMSDQTGLSAWWTTVARLRDSLGLRGLDIQSVDEYAAEVCHPALSALGADSGAAPVADWTPRQLVDAVFAHSWETLLLPQLSASPLKAELPRPIRLFRAFARHSLGQFAVFSHTPSVHESLQASIVRALEGQLTTLASAGADLADVRRGRAIYGAFIDQLVRELRVTPDDAAVFRQIFPLFEPRYVTYDANPDLYDSLAGVASRVLGGKLPSPGSA